MVEHEPRIDQFVPSFVPHDAISNHVVQLQRALSGSGYSSQIYYEHLSPDLEGKAAPFRDRPPGGVILYHASTHSEMAPWLVAQAEAGQVVAVDYHNITPAAYFSGWEPRAARSMVLAREQLVDVLAHAAAALADSAYNELELIDLGHPRTAVGSLLLDLTDYHQAPEGGTEQLLRDQGSPLWLFVGRIAPNKCQHDVIAAFAAYRRLFAPRARLALVGGATSGRYQRSLEAMVEELGLVGAVEFVGSAPFPRLLAYFVAAAVFVCMSEHEGFCVPVIEAMELGVPVVAYRSTAVTETVAGAGVLVDDKDPLAVAVAVDALLGDAHRVAGLAEAGRHRARAFGLEVTGPAFVSRLETLLESATVTA